MKMTHSAKNKYGFVSGAITAPDEADMSFYVAWVRNNDIVGSWILNSAVKDLTSSVIHGNSAVEM